MLMEILPKDLINIIIDYKSQLEHINKFDKSLNKIKKINYLISESKNNSYRWKSNSIYLVEYYNTNSTEMVMSEKSKWYNCIQID